MRLSPQQADRAPFIVALVEQSEPSTPPVRRLEADVEKARAFIARCQQVFVGEWMHETRGEA